MKQTHFQYFKKIDKAFGGSLLKNGNPRVARPVSRKNAMHIVLRSSLAQGHQSLLNSKNKNAVEGIIKRQARRQGLRIYKFANAGNHLHILVRVHSRRALSRFLRAIAGLIARHVLAAQRGAAKGLKFWDARPFTRVVTWGQAFKRAADYVRQNHLEAMGFVAYRPRPYRSSG